MSNKVKLEHDEIIELLGYSHESELQFDLHAYRNLIHSSDVINCVRFLLSVGFRIEKPTTP